MWGDNAIHVHLLAPTAALLAVLSTTSACTAHDLLAAACCITRPATTTSTAPLPIRKFRIQESATKKKVERVALTLVRGLVVLLRVATRYTILWLS
jgi:hypothetical protein